MWNILFAINRCHYDRNFAVSSNGLILEGKKRYVDLQNIRDFQKIGGSSRLIGTKGAYLSRCDTKTLFPFTLKKAFSFRAQGRTVLNSPSAYPLSPRSVPNCKQTDTA